MRGVVVWMGCLILSGATAATGQELSPKRLKAEMARNEALAQYVERNGMPDLAEMRILADKPPWDHKEVRVYYLDRRKEIGFARAFLLGRPEVQVERYSRRMTDADVAAVTARLNAAHTEPVALAAAPPASESAELAPAADLAASSLSPDVRAEAAADRAEMAAGKVEQAADAAERAAQRAEAVVGKMETAFHSGLRK